jgi:hypothetical protein
VISDAGPPIRSAESAVTSLKTTMSSHNLSAQSFHSVPVPESWIKSAPSAAVQIRANSTWCAAVGLIKNRDFLRRDMRRYLAMILDVEVSTTLNMAQVEGI